MPRPFAACSALVLVIVAGCSDSPTTTPERDDDDATGALEGSCNVRGDLTGALTDTLPGTNELACGLPIGSDTGMETLFLIPAGSDSSIGSLSLRIPKVKEKDVGTFDAELTVNVVAGGPRYTSNACRVTIDENTYVKDNDDGTFVTRQYLVRGTGTCNAPLLGSDGAAVELGPFSFVSSALWQ